MFFKRIRCVLRFFLLMISILSFLNTSAQKEVNSQNNKFAKCIIENAQNLIGKKYQAGTLEGDGQETLKYFSDKFDCVTFVEYVVAISIPMVNTNSSTGDFEKNLKNIRYRNGVINGYGSRLHYFTEWILQNSIRGLIKDVTIDLSGVPYLKDIDFMTRNKGSYPKLTDTTELKKVIKAEKRINGHKWMYIPKSKVHKIQSKILNGDIIAITSSIPGLDIVHTGFAIRQKDGIYLLHASESEGKVVISKRNIHNYLNANKMQTGIIILRFY